MKRAISPKAAENHRKMQTSLLADREINHLEAVANEMLRLAAGANAAGLNPSYWAARASGLRTEYLLLPSQQARVAALARSFAARAAAVGQLAAQKTSPNDLMAA